MPKRLLLWNTAFIAIRRNTSCHQNELSNIRIVKHELFIQSDFRYYFMLAIQKSNDATILTLREKCPNMELFLVRIQSEYRKIRTRNNSVFGHFSCSVYQTIVRKFKMVHVTLKSSKLKCNFCFLTKCHPQPMISFWFFS